MREWVIMGLLVAGLALVTSCSNSPDASAPQAPETTDGLKAQINTALETAKAGDEAKLAELVKAMILPDYEAWFKEVLGDDAGAAVAKDYADHVGEFVPGLGKVFTELINKQPFEIIVSKLENPDDKACRGLQRDVLRKMKKAVPLYDVRFRGNSIGMSVWSFVYAKGAFRFAGQMEPAVKD